MLVILFELLRKNERNKSLNPYHHESNNFEARLESSTPSSGSACLKRNAFNGDFSR